MASDSTPDNDAPTAIWSAQVNGSRRRAFLAAGTNGDAIRLTMGPDSLTCHYSWKIQLLSLALGIYFGPVCTVLVWRLLRRQSLAFFELPALHDMNGEEIGYYFAIMGVAANVLCWVLVVHTALSMRYVKFDFANGTVLFRYVGLRSTRCSVPLAAVRNAQTDSMIRGRVASATRLARNEITCYSLDLALADGVELRVFETNNERIARMVAATVNSRLAQGRSPENRKN